MQGEYGKNKYWSMEFLFHLIGFTNTFWFPWHGNVISMYCPCSLPTIPQAFLYPVSSQQHHILGLALHLLGPGFSFTWMISEKRKENKKSNRWSHNWRSFTTTSEKPTWTSLKVRKLQSYFDNPFGENNLQYVQIPSNPGGSTQKLVRVEG